MDFWMFNIGSWVKNPEGERCIVKDQVPKDGSNFQRRYFVEVAKIGGLSRVYDEGELIACGAPRKLIRKQLRQLQEYFHHDPEAIDYINGILRIL